MEPSNQSSNLVSMIPKAQILQYSNSYELQPTTVEKDYVLGWLLTAISNHPEFSKWVFKGGTCLKKWAKF